MQGSFTTKTALTTLLILLLGQLTGCSSVGGGGQDGPPAFQEDVSKIPNAVPKAEPHSRYGNPNSYVVGGKRYYVLKSSKGYSQVGYASWYGMKFHNRLTSMREPYNLYAMTAASKTLPLPTYAEVTNLRNGCTVIVKVNDRGPFKSTRIIDLSYAAAKKLGFANNGTTLVRVTAIDPKTWRAAPMYTPKSYERPAEQPREQQPILAKNQQPAVYMQVGVFKNAANAERLRFRLAELTQSTAQVKKSHVGRELVYRVQIGPILSHTDTTRIKEQLSQHGFHDPIVVMSS